MSVLKAVVVTGSRHVRDDGPWPDFIWRQISALRFGTSLLDRSRIVVIHGDCRGADRMAARAAEAMGMRVLPFPYPSEMGKRGGPYRNRQMLKELLRLRDEGARIEVLAFHPDIEASKGTKDMIAAAEDADVPVRLYERVPA